MSTTSSGLGPTAPRSPRAGGEPIPNCAGRLGYGRWTGPVDPVTWSTAPGFDLQAGAGVHQPAVDEDRGAVDVGAPVAGQEGDHAGDLGGFGHPAERDRGVQDLHLGGVGHGGGAVSYTHL